MIGAEFASGIFFLRNVDKAAKGNPVRAGVAACNGTKVLNSIYKTSAMNTAASVAGKVVNPLIVASGVYSVIKSDDKVKTAVKEGLGISGMFFLEKQMKSGKLGQQVSKGAKWVMEKLSKNAKTQSIGAKILCGLAFVGASIAGYDIASKAGESAVDILRKHKAQKQNYDNALATESRALNANG